MLTQNLLFGSKIIFVVVSKKSQKSSWMFVRLIALLIILFDY